VPTRDHLVAACPGALQVHQAADGGLARIRVPGGRLPSAAFRAVAGAAIELGDGGIELTSRANLQLRGLAPGAEEALAERLAAVGLLPSATHERVRNIMASLLAGRAVRELVGDLDRALCARPGLAALPERFLFAVDLAWPDADVAAVLVDPDTASIRLAGTDVGLRVPRSVVVSTMLACAEAFLALREQEWRIAELDGGAERVAGRAMDATFRAVGVPNVAFMAPLGQIPQGDGLVAVGAAVPLGRLGPDQAAVLGEAAEVVITPWRGVVVPDLQAGSAEVVMDRLRGVGLLLDQADPGVRVSACTGRPGCAKALADVRADAAAMIASGEVPEVAVHWSGCGRRCGRPRGVAIDVVATEDGYTVTKEAR
jgi:precorrin-3B synthase